MLMIRGQGQRLSGDLLTQCRYFMIYPRPHRRPAFLVTGKDKADDVCILINLS